MCSVCKTHRTTLEVGTLKPWLMMGTKVGLPWLVQGLSVSTARSKLTFGQSNLDVLWSSGEWLAEDFTFETSTGETCPPGKAFVGHCEMDLLDLHLPYHELYFFARWELDDGSGWAMTGRGQCVLQPLRCGFGIWGQRRLGKRLADESAEEADRWREPD